MSRVKNKRKNRLRNQRRTPKSKKIANFKKLIKSYSLKKRRYSFNEISNSNISNRKKRLHAKRVKKQNRLQPTGELAKYSYYSKRPNQNIAKHKKNRICRNRKQKRIALFANGHTGKGIRTTSQRIYTEDSKINCKRS